MLIINAFDRLDTVNNPGSDGVAFTIWFAGCSDQCKGCHNPALKDRNNGFRYTVDQVLNIIRSQKVEYTDIIYLGGEPLEQDRPHMESLSVALMSHGYRIWLYTGRDWRYIPEWALRYCNTIKYGRYIDNLKTGGFPASSNQVVMRKIKGGWMEVDLMPTKHTALEERE